MGCDFEANPTTSTVSESNNMGQTSSERKKRLEYRQYQIMGCCNSKETFEYIQEDAKIMFKIGIIENTYVERETMQSICDVYNEPSYLEFVDKNPIRDLQIFNKHHESNKDNMVQINMLRMEHLNKIINEYNCNVLVIIAAHSRSNDTAQIIVDYIQPTIYDDMNQYQWRLCGFVAALDQMDNKDNAPKSTEYSTSPMTINHLFDPEERRKDT